MLEPPRLSAMPSAARLPSATASTTSRPPLTQSPPAKYFGFASARSRDRPRCALRELDNAAASASKLRERDWPIAGITMSQGNSNARPSARCTSTLRPRLVRLDRQRRLRPPVKLHSFLLRACSYSKANAGISASPAAVEHSAPLRAPSGGAALAASIAVLPPPITTTRCPPCDSLRSCNPR